MSDIFISYARKDLALIDKIIEQIELAGYKVWIDREGILPGELWREKIVKAIRNAEVFLLILSRNSIASDNVRREVDLAMKHKICFMPVKIEPVEIPDRLSFQLAGMQIYSLERINNIGPLLYLLEKLPQLKLREFEKIYSSFLLICHNCGEFDHDLADENCNSCGKTLIVV